MAAPANDRFVTVREAARRLDVAYGLLYQWRRGGKIKRYRQGDTIVVDLEEIAARVKQSRSDGDLPVIAEDTGEAVITPNGFDNDVLS